MEKSKIAKTLDVLSAASDIIGTMLRHGDTDGSSLAVMQLVEQAKIMLKDIDNSYILVRDIKV